VRLQYVSAIARALALTACLTNALPIAVKIILFAVIYACFDRLVKRLKNERYTIKYSDASGWELSMGEGGLEPVRILPSTVVTKYALFLHLESRQKPSLDKPALTSIPKKALLIPADSLADDEYRSLIAKLVSTAIKQEQVFVSVDKIKPIEKKNTSV